MSSRATLNEFTLRPIQAKRPELAHEAMTLAIKRLVAAVDSSVPTKWLCRRIERVLFGCIHCGLGPEGGQSSQWTVIVQSPALEGGYVGTVQGHSNQNFAFEALVI